MSVVCPNGFKMAALGSTKKYIPYLSGLICQQCSGERYSLAKGLSSINTNKTLKMAVITSQKEFQCYDCPTGGRCLTGIISKDNFWGFVYDKYKVRFLPCPSSYCCSKTTQVCINYNTCGLNRQGILCGTCKSYLSYFDDKCRKNIRCKQWLFWLLTCIYIILYTIIIMYLHDITYFTKSCFNKTKTFIISFQIKKYFKTTTKTKSR